MEAGGRCGRAAAVGWGLTGLTFAALVVLTFVSSASAQQQPQEQQEQQQQQRQLLSQQDDGSSNGPFGVSADGTPPVEPAATAAIAAAAAAAAAASFYGFYGVGAGGLLDPLAGLGRFTGLGDGLEGGVGADEGGDPIYTSCSQTPEGCYPNEWAYEWVQDLPKVPHPVGSALGAAESRNLYLDTIHDLRSLPLDVMPGHSALGGDRGIPMGTLSTISGNSPHGRAVQVEQCLNPGLHS